MTEKNVVIHYSAIERWQREQPQDIDSEELNRVYVYLQQLLLLTPPEDLVVFEGMHFNQLPGLVAPADTARLSGARAGYCMREARIALEDAGIAVYLDLKGSLA